MRHVGGGGPGRKHVPKNAYPSRGYQGMQEEIKRVLSSTCRLSDVRKKKALLEEELQSRIERRAPRHAAQVGNGAADVCASRKKNDRLQTLDHLWREASVSSSICARSSV